MQCFAVLFIIPTMLAIHDAPGSEHRFESDIRKFEEQDQLQEPAGDLVLFTGSSSIRRWATLEEDFADYHVRNRGFGGSQFRDLLHFFDRLILPSQPKVIVIYSGSHDLHRGNRSPEELLEMVQRFEAKVREELPETAVFYISLKPSIAKWDDIGLDQEANRLIQEYAEEAPGLEFIDIWSPMVKESSPPPERYFLADRNHVSRQGYLLWAEIIRPYLETYLTEE